ncbi:MAG: hypothetical protein LBP22_11745 [Deltaproteobacteria bacterium]|jgi:hypothetical protein|nr:hypothetical protein [Deltaproteobacteria bacterium]
MTELRPFCLLYLWALASKDQSREWLSAMRPALKPAERKQLKTIGLINEVKESKISKAKKVHVTRIYLTDRGFEYLAGHSAASLDTRTYEGTKILGQFLARLGPFLRAQKVTLQEFFGSAEPEARNLTPPEVLDLVKKELENCRARSHDLNLGLKIAQFKQRLPQAPDRLLEEALKELLSQGYLDLYTLNDDPGSLTESDRENEILIAGRPRHVIIFK